ncbi:MAG: hypothetical protein J0L97_01540 [Alphaproteobacteria bacterium]|nr:hypothetical protein [Alphaproteobacteria bacterium]
MKHIRLVCAALMGLSALPAAAEPVEPGYGQFAAQEATRPLMVIRFNQRNVYYQRPLYNAASRALQIKPDVVFSVIATGPDENGIGNRGGEVVQALAGMGIPQRQIQYSAKIDPQAASPEVRIFVR